MTGLFSLCDRDYFALASNSRIFLNEFGLFDLGEAVKSIQTLPPPDKALEPIAPTPYPGQETALIVSDSQMQLNKSNNLI